MKRIFSLLLMLALVLTAFCGCRSSKDDEPDGDQNNHPTGAPLIMQSEHYTLYADVYQYFFAYVFGDFMNQYGSYVSYMGMDTSKPLRDQTFPGNAEGESMTWYDYFSEGAIDMLEMYVNMAEYAISEGIAVDEAGEKEIADMMKQLPEYAESQKVSEEEYLQKQYGSYVTRETIDTCYRLFWLASEGHSKMYNGYTYTDADYETYAEKNPENIYLADFLLLTVGKRPEEDATEEQIAAALAENKAKAEELLASITDEQSFLAAAENYYRSLYTIVPDDTEIAKDAVDTYTESQLQTILTNSKNLSTAYNVQNEAGKWIFDRARTAGEVHMLSDETTGCSELYYIIKPIYRTEQKTIDVRHILLSADNCGSEEQAKTKADELLAQWKAGAATEESFGELATANTADTSSAANGGLYAGVKPGDMVTEFNDWCFDSARNAGDTDIVKTQFGYHIMYFVAYGNLSVWQSTADAALREEAFNADSAKYMEEHPIETHEDVIPSLPDYITAE